MTKESKILIGILTLIVGGLVGVFLLTNQPEVKPTGQKVFTRDYSHSEGSGPVQLVEFGDYQCPACGAAHPIVQQILKDYAGKVTFYFRNFPLSQHQNALVAANAAESAADQGKFWQMHDKLYESQKEWSDLATMDAVNKFGDYAKALGLDGDKVKQAANDQSFKSRIDQDAADGAAIGVDSTPSFYVNGQKTTGNSYNALRDAIEAALKG